MKNIFKTILSCFIVSLVLISCSTTTSNDPNVVLESFFTHLAKKDVDGASKYVTADSKATMQMMKKGLEMAEKMKDSLPQNDPMKDFEDVTFAPAKIMGDSAFVTVSSKSKQRPDADFKLLKESGGWKVDFTMNTLMNMGRKSMEKSGEYDYPDSAKINPDDLQKGRQMADSVLKNIDPATIEKLQKSLDKLK